MNILMYLRKSRADAELEARGEMETLERHRTILLDYAKKNKLHITEIYKELVSGETIASRPVMQRLLDEVEQGKWDGVLVMEIERLARGDTIDQGIVARSFKYGNTKIITPLKTYDPANEYDEEYFEFGLFMSRREYKTINRRIQRGRVQSVKDGKFISSVAPYGYNKVKIKDAKGYTLEINKTESQVVRLIYEQYISGKGMTAIAEGLDKMGIMPRRRNTWSKSTINDILKNPVYTGKIRWSYRPYKKTPNGSGIEVHREKNNDCILVPGLHEAIITDEMFDKAAQVRGHNSRQRTKKDAGLQNPLSGIVYCEKCGALMSRTGAGGHNKYNTLYCRNKQCSNISAPIFLIEEKIIEGLKEWLAGYKIEISRRVNAGQNSSANQLSIDAIEKELAETEKQILNTYDLLERGIYTTEIFTQRNKFLTEKKQNFINALEKAKSQTNNYISAKNILENFIPGTAAILASYFTLNTIQKNYVLKTLLENAVYSKDTPNTKGNAGNANFSVILSPRIPTKN